MKRNLVLGCAVLALAVLAGTTAFAQTPPPGSFQKTCSGASVTGTTLKASCKTFQGASIPASLDYASGCVGDIGNVNGVLVCTGAVGSFSLTCKDATVSGHTLSATCQKKDGSWIPASLPNFQGFQGNISNCDGKLQNGSC